MHTHFSLLLTKLGNLDSRQDDSSERLERTTMYSLLGLPVREWQLARYLATHGAEVIIIMSGSRKRNSEGLNNHWKMENVQWNLWGTSSKLIDGV